MTPNALRILGAIESLPDEEREAFDLVRIQGMAKTEAADVLGTSTKTVQRRLNRADQSGGQAQRLKSHPAAVYCWIHRNSTSLTNHAKLDERLAHQTHSLMRLAFRYAYQCRRERQISQSQQTVNQSPAIRQTTCAAVPG